MTSISSVADLLTKDYGTESMVLKLFTITETGVAIHSTAVYKKSSSFHGRSDSISDVIMKMGLSKQIAPSTTLKASLGFPHFSPKISAKCRLRGELSPSLTAEALFKLPDYKSCNISLRFLREHHALSMGIGGNGVTFRASLGSRSFTVGAQTIHQIDSTHFGIGVQGTLPDGDTASLHYSTMDSKIRARILLSLDKKRKKCIVLDIRQSLSSGVTKFTAAGSWTFGDRTFFNARIDHHGTLKALLKHNREKHNSAVSISAEFNVRNLSGTPKIGFAVVIHKDLSSILNCQNICTSLSRSFVSVMHNIP